MDNPLLLFALVAVIVVIAMLLPRWIRRSSSSRGRRAGRRFEEDQLLEILDELGTTVDLAVGPEGARRLVDGVVERDPRKFTILGDGVYGVRFIETDDAIARLVPADVGVRLQIEEFREYLGRPNTAGFWRDLRAGVVAAAAELGIAHETSPVPSRFDRRETPDQGWRLSR